MTAYAIGDRVTNRAHPELGPAVVTRVLGDLVSARYEASGDVLCGPAYAYLPDGASAPSAAALARYRVIRDAIVRQA